MRPERATAGEVVADRYRLSRVIGRGGTAVVWLACDQRTDRAVAIKVADGLADRGIGSELADAHVRNEAAVGAALQHPGLPAVQDLVEVHGRAAVVMEYVEGRSLAELLSTRGRLSRKHTARIGASIAATLAAMEDADLVHGDLSPGNVLLADDGRAVLIDVGLPGDSAIEQRLHVHLADPDFAAPERLEGWPPSTASDVWALAATLFAAVEGRPRGPRGLRNGHRDERVGLLFKHAGPLAPLLGASLHRAPEVRPSAAYLAEQLSALVVTLTEQPIGEPSALTEPDEVPGLLLVSATEPLEARYLD